MPCAHVETADPPETGCIDAPEINAFVSLWTTVTTKGVVCATALRESVRFFSSVAVPDAIVNDCVAV